MISDERDYPYHACIAIFAVDKRNSHEPPSELNATGYA